MSNDENWHPGYVGLAIGRLRKKGDQVRNHKANTDWRMTSAIKTRSVITWSDANQGKLYRRPIQNVMGPKVGTKILYKGTDVTIKYLHGCANGDIRVGFVESDEFVDVNLYNWEPIIVNSDGISSEDLGRYERPFGVRYVDANTNF